MDKLPVSPTLASEQQDEEAKTLKGQRNVNIIWEVTQAIIALIVTVGVVFVAVHNGISASAEIHTEFPPVLANAFFLIVGFYYSRTNHQAIGGMGRKANTDQTYLGR